MIRIAFLWTLLCVINHVTDAATVVSKQKCKKVVDIAMVVDESGSIGEINFGKIKFFLQDMISRFSVAPFGAHFGLVTYSTRPRLVFSLTRYTNAAQIQATVKNTVYRGGATFTGKALEFTQQYILGQDQDRINVPNVLVIFSDGQSHDHSKAKKETAKMKREGVVILCVGIGRGKVVERLIKQLKELASKPEYVFKSGFDALQTIEDSLVKDMCEAVNPCLSNPCKNNGECLRDGENYTCRCTPDFEGENCEIKKWCPTSFSKRGCFEMPRKKANGQLLFNRRNSIEWTDKWDQFLETIVCDCGKVAKEKGYRYFCIEFYGECWGYNNQLDVNRPMAVAGKCWGKRPNYELCAHEGKNPICVGVASHGYVYELN